MQEEDRPYPEGIAWDEAWWQRQRADAAELSLRQVTECLKANNRKLRFVVAELEFWMNTVAKNTSF